MKFDINDVKETLFDIIFLPKIQKYFLIDIRKLYDLNDLDFRAARKQKVTQMLYNEALTKINILPLFRVA